MKKPYQIESQRAVKRVEEMVADGNPTVQMVLPMAEMVGWLREGVGELIRRAGLQMIELLMEEEVRHLLGERNRPLAGADRQAVGHRARVLRRDGTESTRRAAASSFDPRSGDPVGQLRDVPSRGAVVGDCMGETHARSEHEEIWPGSAGVQRSIRPGEERDQRTFHRIEPGQAKGTDGAAV